MSRTTMKALVLFLFLICCFIQVFGTDHSSDKKDVLQSPGEIDLNISDDENGNPKKCPKLNEINNEKTLYPIQKQLNDQNDEAKEIDQKTLSPAQKKLNDGRDEAKLFNVHEYTDIYVNKAKRKHKEKYDPNHAALRFRKQKNSVYDTVTKNKESFIKQKQNLKFEEDFPSTSKSQNALQKYIASSDDELDTDKILREAYNVKTSKKKINRLLKSAFKNDTLDLKVDKINITDEVKKMQKDTNTNKQKKTIQKYIASSDDESDTNKILRERCAKIYNIDSKHNIDTTSSNHVTDQKYIASSDDESDTNNILLERCAKIYNIDSKHNIYTKSSNHNYSPKYKKETKSIKDNIISSTEDDIPFQVITVKKETNKIEEEDSEMENYCASSIVSFSEFDYNKLCSKFCCICGKSVIDESAFVLCDVNSYEGHGAHLSCAGLAEKPEDEWYCDQHLQKKTDIKLKEEKENLEEEQEEEEETDVENDIEFLINMMNCQNQTQTKGQEPEKATKNNIIPDRKEINPKLFDVKQKKLDIDIESKKSQIKKITICEYEHCRQKNTAAYLTKGPVSQINLCHACYKYERKNKYLISRSERRTRIGKKTEPELKFKRKSNVLDEEEGDLDEFNNDKQEINQTPKLNDPHNKFEHIGIHYVANTGHGKGSYKCHQKIYQNIKQLYYLSNNNYDKCVDAVQQKNEEKIINGEPVDPFIGEKIKDIRKSQKYPHDGLYYNQRNKLWYSVAYVKNEKKVLARHNDEDECTRLANEKTEGNTAQPYNDLFKRSININHYGMAFDKFANNYKFSQTLTKQYSTQSIVSNKDYWKCVDQARNFVERKIENQEPVDPFVGEYFNDIEKSEKYPGIYKNIRKNVWFSFGFVGNNKMVLAMDKEEVVCKTKTDERIKLEKEQNNLEVVPFYRSLKKIELESSKTNTSPGNQEESIRFCENCQRRREKLTKGKFSDKFLCNVCYMYEYRYGQLVPLYERKHNEKHKNHELVEVRFCPNDSLCKCKCCVPNKANLVYHIRHFGMSKDTRGNSFIFRSKIDEKDRETYMIESDDYNKAVKEMQKKNQECIDQFEPVDPFVGEEFEDIQKSEHDGLYYNRRNELWYLVAYVNGDKIVLAQEKTEIDCLSKGEFRLKSLQIHGHEVKMCNNLISKYTKMKQKMENEAKETIDIKFTDQLDN